jgi:hypothetical protein
MTSEPRDPPLLDRDLADHPGTLGDLADIFARRQIAVGIDANGSVVFVRPRTLVIDCRNDAERRRRLADAVSAFNAGQFDWTAVARERRRKPSKDGVVPPLDVVAVDLKGVKLGRIGSERRWTLEAVRELRRFLLRVDDSLTSEYCTVMFGCPNVKGNPAGAPAYFAGELAFVADTATVNGRIVMLSTAEPATRPSNMRARLTLSPDRARPRVLVLDTGLSVGTAAVTHPDLRESCRLDWPRLVVGPSSDPDAPPVVDDEDEVDDDSNGTIDFEAGHGTFIAGIVRQICPDADIFNAGVLSSFGDGDVFGVLDALDRVLSAIGPVDVVVMSFGLFFPDDDPGLFGSWLQMLLGDAVGVAAAGNENTCRQYFPAALDEVIAVGGLVAGGKAWFSNFGPWVDACAPAVDVVSTFFEGVVEKLPELPNRRYEGWARWSGTSFSAPKVAALIAQEMYLNGGTAKQAWKRMISHKLYRYPDLGIVFNV